MMTDVREELDEYDVSPANVAVTTAGPLCWRTGAMSHAARPSAPDVALHVCDPDGPLSANTTTRPAIGRPSSSASWPDRCAVPPLLIVVSPGKVVVGASATTESVAHAAAAW